jgi:hypothetical protein
VTTQEAKALVQSVLEALECATPAFVNLLVATMAQESLLGQWEKQEHGPALGVFMTEPATWQDIYDNFLKFNPGLETDIQLLTDDMPPTAQSVVGNHDYACAIAACSYLRHHEPALTDPDPNDAGALYAIYKRCYNSSEGAATEDEWLRHWAEFNIGGA